MRPEPGKHLKCEHLDYRQEEMFTDSSPLMLPLPEMAMGANHIFSLPASVTLDFLCCSVGQYKFSYSTYDKVEAQESVNYQ